MIAVAFECAPRGCDCVVEDSGGGIPTLRGALTVTDTTIRRNSGSDGGIHHRGTSLHVVRAKIHDKHATNRGGALRIEGGSPSVIRDTTFSANGTTSDGGAISTYAAVTIANSTLSGNPPAARSTTTACPARPLSRFSPTNAASRDPATVTVSRVATSVPSQCRSPAPAQRASRRGSPSACSRGESRHGVRLHAVAKRPSRAHGSDIVSIHSRARVLGSRRGSGTDGAAPRRVWHQSGSQPEAKENR